MWFLYKLSQTLVGRISFLMLTNTTIGYNINRVCPHPGKLASKKLIYSSILAGLCGVWDHDLSYLPQRLKINNSCRDHFTHNHPCEAPHCKSMVHFTHVWGTDFKYCCKCHNNVYIFSKLIGWDELRNSCLFALQNKCQVKWEMNIIWQCQGSWTPKEIHE